MASSKQIGNSKVGKINLDEFKAEPAETRFAIANEIFQENPSEFISEALMIMATSGRPSPINWLPPEVAMMDDILTQQMVSTYRREIVPLVVKKYKK